MVKGSVEVPMTGESLVATPGSPEMIVKHNYGNAENVRDRKTVDGKDQPPSHLTSQEAVRNEKNHRRRHRQPANPDLVPDPDKLHFSQLSSYSDPNSD